MQSFEPTEVGGPALLVGPAIEDWTGDARFHEYSSAVDPLRTGTIPPVPVVRFPAPPPAGKSVETVLDLSEALGTPWPATGPALLARYLRVAAGTSLEVSATATSILAYCLAGRGVLEFECPGKAGAMAFAPGDVLTVPAPELCRYRADQDALLYHVDDSPLLAYLGAVPGLPRFAPTRFDGTEARAALDQVGTEPEAALRNRVAVLLGNSASTQTLTATHTLWAMLGVLPVGALQRAHRHQSIALDLIVACRPGCYSLVGAELDDRGHIVDPERVDWEAGGAFVTPAGLWHSHHNESGAPAHLFPVQDAGLQTYLRTLDIRFSG